MADIDPVVVGPSKKITNARVTHDENNEENDNTAVDITLQIHY